MSYVIKIFRGDELVSQFNHEPGQSILKAAEYNLQKIIKTGCRGGGCGICKVRIINGQYEKKMMSKAHIGDFEHNNNIVLACRVFPLSDMELCVQNEAGCFSVQ